ncbi:MAG: hypothetical protein HY554_02680 [Elusimicrobia bacterium]|nr:hypothetical protein [Elusimicrobiota bacterium]
MTRFRALRISAWLLLGALVALGCEAPRFVRFVSPYKDFTCDVPWGWAVYLDSAGSDYANATFTGPLDPDFFRGTPSLSVRWYAYGAPHRLPDGSYETYASTADFSRQMLRYVYGSKAYTKAGADFDQQLSASKGVALADASRVKAGGAEATHFVVYNTLPAPAGMTLGVVQDQERNSVVRQRHAYVLVPMRGGFYALIYPATREGFEKHKTSFFHLIKSLKILKEGPAGPAFRP